MRPVNQSHHALSINHTMPCQSITRCPVTHAMSGQLHMPCQSIVMPSQSTTQCSVDQLQCPVNHMYHGNCHHCMQPHLVSPFSHRRPLSAPSMVHSLPLFAATFSTPPPTLRLAACMPCSGQSGHPDLECWSLHDHQAAPAVRASAYVRLCLVKVYSACVLVKVYSAGQSVQCLCAGLSMAAPSTQQPCQLDAPH